MRMRRKNEIKLLFRKSPRPSLLPIIKVSWFTTTFTLLFCLFVDFVHVCAYVRRGESTAKNEVKRRNRLHIIDHVNLYKLATGRTLSHTPLVKSEAETEKKTRLILKGTRETTGTRKRGIVN